MTRLLHARTPDTAVPRHRATRWWDRRNPLARLLGPLLLGVLNALTLDPVTVSATLLVAVAALPATGLAPATAARLARPVAIGAVVVAAVNTLAAGAPWDAAAATGLLTGARLLAVALPGVWALATVDVVDLTDSTVRQLRLPPRFADGALAALQLLPSLVDDWRLQGLATRARGGFGRGPASRVRQAGSRVLRLLVAAVRRATRLALALDARGFGEATAAQRRSSPWQGADSLLAAGSCAVAAGILALSLVMGSWSPILG